MKLYINVNKQSLVGYKNINLATDVIDLKNLNTICEQAEATEIILDNVLEYLNFNSIKDFVEKIATRLRLKGKLIINSTNIAMVIDSFYNGIIGYVELNSIMFGTEQIKKCSVFDTNIIERMVKSINLNIESVELNGNNFTITAQRTN